MHGTKNQNSEFPAFFQTDEDISRFIIDSRASLRRIEAALAEQNSRAWSREAKAIQIDSIILGLGRFVAVSSALAILTKPNDQIRARELLEDLALELEAFETGISHLIADSEAQR